jgi:hypothetical protein
MILNWRLFLRVFRVSLGFWGFETLTILGLQKTVLAFTCASKLILAGAGSSIGRGDFGAKTLTNLGDCATSIAQLKFLVAQSPKRKSK